MVLKVVYRLLMYFSKSSEVAYVVFTTAVKHLGVIIVVRRRRHMLFVVA